MNRPAFVEASWFKSDHSGDVTGLLPPVVCLSFCRRNISQGSSVRLNFKQIRLVSDRSEFGLSAIGLQGA